MSKRILLSIVLTFTLSTNAWGQCDSGCDSGIAPTVASGGLASGGCDTAVGGCGGAVGGCDSGGCAGGAVGQSYFDDGCSQCGDACCYVRVFTGFNYADDIDVVGAAPLTFRNGWAIGGAWGRRNGNRRVELDLTYRHNSLDAPVPGNVSVVASMANVLWDIDMIRINDFSFYGGLGIGLAYADANINNVSAYDTGFAYQFIGGMEKYLNNGAKGFVEYRYLDSDFDFGGGDVDYNAHNVFFGMEFRR